MIIDKLLKQKRLVALLLLTFAMAPLALYAAGDKGKKDKDEESKPVPRDHPMTLQEEQESLARNAAAALTPKGVETCLKCHDEDNVPPIFPIFKTKHAVVADPRTPFAHENQCEVCHGNGGEHAQRVRRGEVRPRMLNFGMKAWTPPEVQNGRCLQCHQNHQRIEWQGSVHEFNQVPCAGCHTIHAAHDPVLDRVEQPSVCYRCHVTQRAQFEKAYHHPVREGELACSSCHDPHSGEGGDLRVSALAREKCTSCHADKRGPFFWEHAPVAEDCTLCHDPHGANNAALLKKRPPQLCQECHSQFDHPSVRYDGLTVRPFGSSRYAEHQELSELSLADSRFQPPVGCGAGTLS